MRFSKRDKKQSPITQADSYRGASVCLRPVRLSVCTTRPSQCTQAHSFWRASICLRRMRLSMYAQQLSHCTQAYSFRRAFIARIMSRKCLQHFLFDLCNYINALVKFSQAIFIPLIRARIPGLQCTHIHLLEASLKFLNLLRANKSLNANSPLACSTVCDLPANYLTVFANSKHISRTLLLDARCLDPQAIMHLRAHPQTPIALRTSRNPHRTTNSARSSSGKTR